MSIRQRIAEEVTGTLFFVGLVVAAAKQSLEDMAKALLGLPADFTVGACDEMSGRIAELEEERSRDIDTIARLVAERGQAQLEPQSGKRVAS